MDRGRAVPRREHLDGAHLPVRVDVGAGHELLQSVLAHAVGPLPRVDDAIVAQVVVAHPLLYADGGHRPVDATLLRGDELGELTPAHDAVGVGVVLVEVRVPQRCSVLVHLRSEDLVRVSGGCMHAVWPGAAHASGLPHPLHLLRHRARLEHAALHAALHAAHRAGAWLARGDAGRAVRVWRRAPVGSGRRAGGAYCSQHPAGRSSPRARLASRAHHAAGHTHRARRHLLQHDLLHMHPLLHLLHLLLQQLQMHLLAHRAGLRLRTP
eukprot:scaffold25682_cov63-Phaeocystis_antarctica.AAC.4